MSEEKKTQSGDATVVSSSSLPTPHSSPESPAEPTLRRVCSELIALRERTDRQHRLFEQTLAQTRDDLQTRLDRFAGETQQAYQRLRDELTGEKRHSLALLNALVDMALDVRQVSAGSDSEPMAVAARRAEALLTRFGVHPYDAIIGSAYEPAVHERVGGVPVPGMEPSRVAQQVEPGYASQQPDFVLRRAKVLITE